MTFPNKAIHGVWIVLALAHLAVADQVVTREQSFVGAKIVGLQEGQLRFHTAVGIPHSVWLDEVGLIIVDQGGIFADFNQAERFRAGGESQRAIVRYRRTERLAEDFWQDLIRVRMYQTHDAAGQLDHAMAKFIQILEGQATGPPAAARLFPTGVPDRPNARVGRAIKKLDTALNHKPNAEQRVLLEIVRYDILRRCEDKRATSAALRVAEVPIPRQSRSDRVYEIVLDALGRALEKDLRSGALAGLNRAIRQCPRSLLPDFLLLKGRALLRGASTREDYIRASWPFLRTAIHFPQSDRAPDGLFGAALAVERLGRYDRAIQLLEECLAHAWVGEETQLSASGAIERLRTRSKD